MTDNRERLAVSRCPVLTPLSPYEQEVARSSRAGRANFVREASPRPPFTSLARAAPRSAPVTHSLRSFAGVGE